MLRKIAIALIVVSAVVIAGVVLFLRDSGEPQFQAIRANVTLRSSESGDFVGFLDRHGARAWLGIPYAQPPVDDLRWKAPRRPIPHEGVKEAIEIGSACTQKASSVGPTTEIPDINNVVGDEDCLYLNIWSAPNSVSAPVMLWLHGGGNTIGHGGSYSGAKLATTHNVVVVTINYRLGLLGWFLHPKLSSGSELDRSGNYGTLDVVRALEWTRDNIVNFGGDPNNITVFGESAGGTDTLAMISSPEASGLFHKAIVQSGSFRQVSPERAMNFASEGGHGSSSNEVIVRLLLKDGLAENEAAARIYLEQLSTDALRKYLGEKSASSIYGVVSGGGFGMINLPMLISDGHVLNGGSAEVRLSDVRNHNSVPVILGTNRDEPTLFMVQSPRFVETSLWIFRSLKDEEDYLKRVYYGARAWKARGADQLANFLSASGNDSVFVYRFDWDEEPDLMFYDLSTALGAGHGMEIAFVFGEFNSGMGLGYLYPNDDNQFELSEAMMSYWAEFAYTGRPGRGRNQTNTDWLSWGKDGKTSIILDTPADGGIRMGEEIVTYVSLKAELVADTSFENKDTHCEIYTSTFGQTDLFDNEEYEALGCGPTQLN